MTISEIKDQLASSLNSTVFSLNSIPGIIALILIITIIYGIYRRATRAVSWTLGIIVLYEAFFCLSLTGFNNLIPLSTIFKYDICTSLAQLFVGTPISDGFLYVASFLAAVMGRIWYIGENIFRGAFWLLQQGWYLIQEAWHAFWTR